MKRSRRSFHRVLSWKRIPAGRRHFYVYSLLLLGAIVGDRSYDVIAAGENEDMAAAQAEVARIEGMKESTLSLYY